MLSFPESLWTSFADGRVRLRIDNSCPQPPITVHQMFKESLEKYGSLNALASRKNGKWEKITFSEYYCLSRKAAKSFLKVGTESKTNSLFSLSPYKTNFRGCFYLFSLLPSQLKIGRHILYWNNKDTDGFGLRDNNVAAIASEKLLFHSSVGTMGFQVKRKVGERNTVKIKTDSKPLLAEAKASSHDASVHVEKVWFFRPVPAAGLYQAGGMVESLDDVCYWRVPVLSWILA